jgi:hypothetical protein
MRKFAEYLSQEYGAIEECEDESMIEKMRTECEHWFERNDRVTKDLHPVRDIEYINAWNSLIKNDKEFMTDMYITVRRWDKFNERYELFN